MDKIKTQSTEAEVLTNKYRTIEAAKRLQTNLSQPFEYGVVNYKINFKDTWTADTITITYNPTEPITRPLTNYEINTVVSWETERYKQIKEKQNG